MMEELVEYPPEAADGVPVATLNLEMTFPASWKGAYEQLGDAVLPLLRADEDDFEDRKMGAGMSPDGGAEGVELVEAFRRPFPGGVLHKRLRHRFVSQAAHCLSAEVAYSTEGEGDDLQQAASDRSVGMLEWMRVAAEKGFDARCLVTLRCRLFGEIGGMIFHDLLRDGGRELPLVLLSEASSYPEGFFGWMEPDLAGKVVLAELDEGATSCLTELVGKGWSCFSGSVRVYQPGWKEEDDFARHRIWRRRQVIPEGQDDGFAKRRFRHEVLRELLTRQLDWRRESGARLADRIAGLEQRGAGLEGELAQAKAALENEAAENEAHRKEVGDLKGEAERMRQERKGLRAQLKERAVRPRRTVQSAVDWAIGMYGGKGRGTLVFEDRVLKGVDKLNQDAGPPEEVFHNLATLHEYAREMRRGSLGDNAIAWFKGEGRDCDVSPESKGTLEEFKDRPWVGKGDPDWHMKPNNLQGAEGVRIHFKWEPDIGKVRVQWIGPHRKNRLTS